MRLLRTLLGVRPHALPSGLFAPERRHEYEARLGVLLWGASCPFLERRLLSLLLPVDRAVPLLMEYPQGWRGLGPVHELQDRHYAALET